MLIRDSLRRLLQLQIGALITDFVTGRVPASRRAHFLPDPKSEVPNPKPSQRRNWPSGRANLGFRPSFGLRVSVFGFLRGRQPFSAPRPAPHWLRDLRGPPAPALVPGLGASPLLVPEPIADLAGITQDGIMLPLRTAARASALGDLLLLPPVLAGRLHLRRPSPTMPFLSSVKCSTRSGRHSACRRGRHPAARTGTRNLSHCSYSHCHPAAPDARLYCPERW